MKFWKTALAALLLVSGAAELSAQTFFLRKEKGLAEVKFLPPVGGQSVQLFVDDKPAGTLPVTIWVFPGPHKFTFAAPGEESKTLVNVIKGDTVVPSVFTPRGFPLTVNTNVPGAFIAVDGSPINGNTTTVTPGSHTLTVSAPGHDNVTLPFNQPRNANTLNVTLIANTFPLTVNTNVPGAFLAVDGAAFNGNMTSVSAGQHTLSVSAPGYQPVSLPFTQPRNANTLNVTLVANIFPVTVNTNVPGAFLAIDGTPFNGNTTSVSAGQHTLTVSAPGYQQFTLQFNQPRNANTLNVSLIALTGTISVNLDLLPKNFYKVFINGSEIKRPGPQTLAAGTYQIRISAGAFSTETTVTLSPAQVLTVTPSVQWNVQ